MEILGNVSHTIYENDSFSIRTFFSKEAVELPNGKMTNYFHVKGNYLPSKCLDIKIEGEFDSKPFVNKSGKKSFTFNVESFQEVKISNEKSIVNYLLSVKGIGKVTAWKIYDKFGDKTFEILDNDITVLTQIEGIGKNKLEIIAADYLSRGAARELYIYLSKYNISKTKINKIYRKYRGSAVERVSKTPYSLYLQGLLSFDAAEKISKTNSLDSLSDERIQASIVESLRRAETNGHTYLDWGELIKKTETILEVQNNSLNLQKKVAVKIRGNLPVLSDYIAHITRENRHLFYRRPTFQAEVGAAKNIRRLASEVTTVDYMDDIIAAEKELDIQLSDEQRSAVSQAMNSSLSIVTGGPGTGKTSFQKVLLNVYRKHSKKSIALAAPTGKAATRMAGAAGLPAQTIHQLLHLIVTDEDMDIKPKPVEAGLVIIDEMSMVDIFVADKLFSAIQPGTKVVCVGDAFQLPSVGCGEVLQDMIRSKAIPVTLFTKVFRQQDGSIIASNAAEINQGHQSLEYGDAFTFIPVEKSENILEEALLQYKRALKKYGPDETTVLTPYRRTTATGVNEMNPQLKEFFNPIVDKNRTSKIDGMDIYKGDKIMYTKNVYIGNTLLSNGDTGYVTKISIRDNIQVVTIDFKDGRVCDLMGDDLKHLVPAYATTVHKSQGSEYKCCIIIIDPKHSILLKRNLVYTAITRAKEKVILIGSKEAFKDSILLEDTGTRHTMLAKFLAS